MILCVNISHFKNCMLCDMFRVNIVNSSLKCFESSNAHNVTCKREKKLRKENSLFGKFAFDNDKRRLHYRIVFHGGPDVTHKIFSVMKMLSIRIGFKS